MRYPKYRLVSVPFYTPGAGEGEGAPALPPITLTRPSIYYGCTYARNVPGVAKVGDRYTSLLLLQGGEVVNPPDMLFTTITHCPVNVDLYSLHISGVIDLAMLPYDYELDRFSEAHLNLWFLELI